MAGDAEYTIFTNAELDVQTVLNAASADTRHQAEAITAAGGISRRLTKMQGARVDMEVAKEHVSKKAGKWSGIAAQNRSSRLDARYQTDTPHDRAEVPRLAPAAGGLDSEIDAMLASSGITAPANDDFSPSAAPASGPAMTPEEADRISASIARVRAHLSFQAAKQSHRAKIRSHGYHKKRRQAAERVAERLASANVALLGGIDGDVAALERERRAAARRAAGMRDDGLDALVQEGAGRDVTRAAMQALLKSESIARAEAAGEEEQEQGAAGVGVRELVSRVQSAVSRRERIITFDDGVGAKEVGESESGSEHESEAEPVHADDLRNQDTNEQGNEQEQARTVSIEFVGAKAGRRVHAATIAEAAAAEQAQAQEAEAQAGAARPFPTGDGEGEGEYSEEESSDEGEDDEAGALVREAFAATGAVLGGDDMDATRDAVLSREVDAVQSMDELVVPGWGAWAGAGAPERATPKWAIQAQERQQAARKAQLAARQDAGRRNVVISEHVPKALRAHQAACLPMNINTLDEYRAKMADAAVAPEILGDRQFARAVLPATLTRRGAALTPIGEVGTAVASEAEQTLQRARKLLAEGKLKSKGKLTKELVGAKRRTLNEQN